MMTWSWRLERAYWAGEWPLLWRRGWWLLPTLILLAMMSAIPFVGQLINWMLAGMIVVIVLRRILAARHFDTLLQRRWQSDVANSILASLPALARNLRLEVKDLSGVALVTGAGLPEWDGYTCVLPVSMPPGLAREDLVAVTPRIAQAFNAVRVTVVGQQSGALALRIEYVDALAQPFSFPIGMPWEGGSVLMGIADGGGEWCLPLGPHTFVAGSSGSGKASLVWGLRTEARKQARPDGGMSLNAWHARYWPTIDSGVRPATARGYDVAWRKRVKPWFGHRKIETITAGDIEQAIGQWDGSASTRNDALSMLSRLLDGAARAGILEANPARLARRPKEEGSRRFRSRALTADEVATMLAAVEDGPYRAYPAALVYTGMRAGEASALRVGTLTCRGA